jgi:hypothetical protein
LFVVSYSFEKILNAAFVVDVVVVVVVVVVVGKHFGEHG